MLLMISLEISITNLGTQQDFVLGSRNEAEPPNDRDRYMDLLTLSKTCLLDSLIACWISEGKASNQKCLPVYSKYHHFTNRV